MSLKYIVTNGNEYLIVGSKTKKTTNVKKATLFRYEQVINYLRNNLSNDVRWAYRKVSNKPSGKNYVITNGVNYAGEDGVTFKFAEAKRFNSEADALRYVDARGGFFDKVYIITEDSDLVDFEEKKQFTKEQLLTLGVSTNKTKRIVFPPETRQIIYEKNNGRCAICGKKIKYKNFTIDHILPLDRGGENHIDNLQPACEQCNSLKSNSTDNEFVKSIANTLTYQIEHNDNKEVMDKVINSCVKTYISKMFGEEVANAVMM